MTTKKYEKYIVEGVDEPILKLPFHREAPIKRILMLDDRSFPESELHIAVHAVDGNVKKYPKYSELHKHNYNEVNLILSEKDELVYKIQIEEETYRVSSPATVYIPKGMRHSAEAVSGMGIFVCILLSGNYKAQK